MPKTKEQKRQEALERCLVREAIITEAVEGGNSIRKVPTHMLEQDKAGNCLSCGQRE